MKTALIITATVILLLIAVELIITAYFYKIALKRKKTKVERTIEMSGTDWDKYIELLQDKKAFFLSMPREELYIKSDDGLKLHAAFIPNSGAKKIVLCFHGYTSNCMSDYIGLSDYYLNRGYAMLLPDLRAHGESEGEYIGFGCKDRFDALLWIKKCIELCGDDCKILLHGTSMGAATALMTSGLNLPKQVKGIVGDCGFTTPKAIFTHVLKKWYHIPAFPIINIASLVNKKKAGFALDECNSADEVKKSQVPILLIHGENDTFVPCYMCDEIHKNCKEGTKKLIIKGASHAESYYKDTKAYENALTDFTKTLF